jgi:hypothetical protein
MRLITTALSGSRFSGLRLCRRSVTEIDVFHGVVLHDWLGPYAHTGWHMLYRDVFAFADTEELRDDLTLAALKVLPDNMETNKDTPVA